MDDAEGGKDVYSIIVHSRSRGETEEDRHRERERGASKVEEMRG